MSPSASSPLAGRVVVVTGVSRRAGIGAALVRRLLADGASVLASGWSPHDAAMPWGADPGSGAELAAALDPTGARLAWTDADLAEPTAPRALLERAVAQFGAVDGVVANHARSSHRALDAVDAGELDRCWAVNARASVLLAQALGALRSPGPGGRLVLFTSGQHRGPMADEIPYAVSKGAIHQMTPTLAAALADRGVTVNCVNPGPVDTGYARGEAHARVARRFPSGRWGLPEDTARLVAWLLSDEAGWLTGQVIDHDGGFRYGG
jgi:3-oxoacyl-[acyl-carrier protein] reductase